MPRVVDQDIDAAPGRFDLPCHGLDMGAIRYVTGHRQGLATSRGDLGGDPCRLLEVEVDHRDLGTLPGIGPGDAGTDALSGAGDDCDTMIELHCLNL